MTSVRYVFAIVLLGLLATLDNAESARIDETRARLVGSGMRDDEPGAQGGGLRFATFPLVSVDRREMVFGNTINRMKTRYRRAAGGSPA